MIDNSKKHFVVQNYYRLTLTIFNTEMTFQTQ